MSKENLVKLMEVAAADEQLMQKLQSADSYEVVKSLATARGFELGDLSAEEAQRTVQVLSGAANEELSEEELELVAGGQITYSDIVWEFSDIRWEFNDPKGLPKSIKGR